MSNSPDRLLKDLMQGEQNKAEVTELCRRFGAAFVIGTARAYIAANERKAAQEHARWRAEMERTQTPKGLT